jgi:glucosamine--fructose-6-phosphate aminotransferase (isomerizing)
MVDSDQLHLRRSVGKVSGLEERLSQNPAPGQIGIAHTRWATHGGPSEINAHPHLDARDRVAIVHNGIIENHRAIRQFLEKQGVIFQSETDSESLAQLIGFFYEQTGDFVAAVRQAIRDVRGTFGLVALCRDIPHTLVAARRGSPLIVGIGDGEFVVASDGSAIAEHTHRVVYLDDNELVTLGPDGMAVTDLDQQLLEKSVDTLEVTLEEIELAGHEHHMHKEIHEQPRSVQRAMVGRLDFEAGAVHLGGLNSMSRDFPHVHRVLLTGCGTAWHAALIGEYLFEELARIPTDVEYASELRYRNPIVEEGTIAIALSQSGETADTLAALREVRMKGAKALGIVNVVGSTIARETDAGVYLHAGAEIGVASTKAFTAQVAVLALMATDLGRRRNLSHERTIEVMRALEGILKQIEEALQTEDRMKSIAEWIVERDNCLYLGRGVNYPAALEGALKLKEVSYIHAEGMPAAEMKHGPIALIDEGMPVIVVAPKDHTFDKVMANIEEVKSRGGRVLAITTDDTFELDGLADEVVRVPVTMPLLSPLLTSIPLQLLAYHAALMRGQNVDKPRYLAKSVTVE